jgi:hypothetical protein
MKVIFNDPTEGQTSQELLVAPTEDGSLTFKTSVEGSVGPEVKLDIADVDRLVAYIQSATSKTPRDNP